MNVGNLQNVVSNGQNDSLVSDLRNRDRCDKMKFGKIVPEGKYIYDEKDVSSIQSGTCINYVCGVFITYI